MELVKIANTGDKPFTLAHDGKGALTLAPGEEKIVPSDYATVFFGHPGLRDDTKERARTQSYKQTLGLWGVYGGITTPEEQEELLPKFEVTDLDGNRLWMLLDDPTGEHATDNSTLNVTTADESLAAQVAAMQSQVEKLTALLAQQQAPVESTPPSAAPADPSTAQADRNEARDDIPKAKETTPVSRTDTPRTPRSGPRSGS